MSSPDEVKDQYAAEKFGFFHMSADMMCLAGADGYFKALNTAWTRALGWTHEELCAQPFLSFVHPDDVESTLLEVAKLAQGVTTLHFTNRYRTKSGGYRWLSWITQPEPETGLLYAIARDITESHERAAELIAKNAELEEAVKLGHAQQQIIQSLSTPVLQVWEHILVLPLVGILDERRIETMTDRLLQEISVRTAKFVILDITGVARVDTYTVAFLLRVVGAAQLLGARSIITGVRPDVAMSLSQLYADLPELTTAQTLEKGLRIALRARHQQHFGE